MSRTIRQVEERLRDMQFAGRSYAGLTPEVTSGDAARAAAEFEANAAEDLAFVLDRYREVQNAIVIAASDLADAASYVAARYAGTPDEAREIRLAIAEPIDALVNVSQGTATTTAEDAQ